MKQPEPNTTDWPMAQVDELINIVKNEPVFPGDTISHQTANNLDHWGYAERDSNSGFVSTPKAMPKLKELFHAGIIPSWQFQGLMKLVNATTT